MEWEQLESELLALAERLGVGVRHVRYEGEGGLCVIGGKKVLAINDSLDLPDRIGVMARALARLPGIDDVYVLPEVRRLLDRHAQEGQD